ncbi:hypothetical protein PTI45_03439 [Paenibacillus nuruki]|uniref:Uncharacterized protein n=1 Tax=Paenibacillus nuruki TaxID=1886670 RepID=A0A1E3L005_9BACL|nr:hypothetical protein [Paenibacillus nuruki]ODP27118.1 hypothetical protein PTI45_03439 [Paenibacillus nuruki]
MIRLPIFSVHSVLSISNSTIRIQGRALDTIKIKSKVFDLNSNLSCIEEISIGNKQSSELSIMSEGIVTIKIDKDSFDIGEFLYGEQANDYIQTISFEQATDMAEKFIRQDLVDYVEDPHVLFLHEVTLEAEYCWFFFYNPKIIIPEEKWLLKMLGAYAISKKGEVSHTYNYLDDSVKARDYLNVMSGYFNKKGL